MFLFNMNHFFLHTVKWSKSSIPNNLIQWLFVYTQSYQFLNYQVLPLQGQSGPESNGNEVRHSPKL